MRCLDSLFIIDLVRGEARRIGAELLRRGASVPTVDLLIAATAKLHQKVLVTAMRRSNESPI